MLRPGARRCGHRLLHRHAHRAVDAGRAVGDLPRPPARVLDELLRGLPGALEQVAIRTVAPHLPPGARPRQVPDLSIATLVRNPLVGEATTSSYPLLLYATFWYPHIPESNLRSPAADGLVAPVIYVLALGPTLLMVAGLVRAGCRCWPLVVSRPLSSVEFQRRSTQGLAVALLLANLALVVITGLRSEVWSVFHGRLLFPSFAGLLVLLSLGLEALPDRSRRALALAARAMLGLLYTSFLLYFVLVGLAARS